MGAATFHLGRPRYAFRAFLGWRSSWMSREILAFGGYLPLVALSVLTGGWAAASGGGTPGLVAMLHLWLRGGALALGLAGSVCSVMIYVDTNRPAWSLSRTAPSFLATGIGLGALGAAAGRALGGPAAGGEGAGTIALLLAIGLLALMAKLLGERRLLRHAAAGGEDVRVRSARLLSGPLQLQHRLRTGWAMAGALALGAIAICIAGGEEGCFAGFSWLALACFSISELLERRLFFQAEASPAMPGL